MTPRARDAGGCAVSVIISTYNRSRDLARALASVLHQEGGVPYEVLIVDNNSTDDTRQVVEEAMTTSTVPLRYHFEPRQGVSYGRNTGIENASAPILAFTDDDCRPAPNWVLSILRAFERHPEIDCIGGRVVPCWPDSVPEWFTWRQVSPLALCEHGDREVAVDATHAGICLITANLACRRAAFDKSGSFSPAYPRGQDREIQLRMWRAGCRGLYAPDVLVTVDVPSERLTKEHFRKWFRRYGDVHAQMRLLETIDRDGRLVEPGSQGNLFGVAPFLYRQLAGAVLSWMAAGLRFRAADRFLYENRVRYLRRYIQSRIRDDRSVHESSIPGELARFIRSRVSSRLVVNARGATRPPEPRPDTYSGGAADSRLMRVPEQATGTREGGDAGGAVMATLLIATYNRARLLRDTLESVAALRTPGDVTWDAVVVDNNSTDDTREVVAAAAASFPVRLTYLFEPRQGKSIALNTALQRISASVVIFSDDDVRMPEDWLEAALRPLIRQPAIAYVGGPVRPLWEGTPPAWQRNSTRSMGVLALLDYGPEPFVFEERCLIPLGVNMAVRRSVIETVGGFQAALGRSGRSLLGQEQAEFFARCRRTGARGLYVPAMHLTHLVPANRLSLGYFLRWWFWKGVSQARWHRMHRETELGVNLGRTSKVFGIPRFHYGEVLRAMTAGLWTLASGRPAKVPDHLASVAYFAGYAREIWFGPRTFAAEAAEPAGIQSNVAAR